MSQQLIRPAIDTLRELNGGRLLDDLAIHLVAACNAVRDHNKGAEITVKIKVKPYTVKGTRLVEQPVFFMADVTSNLPQPEKEGKVFFLDEHGNPTSTPLKREQELELRIASSGEERHG